MSTQRVAVITGGGGGMGLACARKLGRTHRLLLAEIDEARLDRALRHALGVRFRVQARETSLDARHLVRLRPGLRLRVRVSGPVRGWWSGSGPELGSRLGLGLSRLELGLSGSGLRLGLG